MMVQAASTLAEAIRIPFSWTRNIIVCILFIMASDSSGWTLPEKWSEDLVDENGSKLSKTCVMNQTHFFQRLYHAGVIRFP